jgi:GT2 family glycosyltransferase
MTTPISVFMITYHRPDTIVKALAALAEADGDFHVFLIDNSAGAIDHILDQYNNNGRFSIYKNDKNIGKGLSYKNGF